MLGLLGAVGCEGRCGGAATPAPGVPSPSQSLSEAERRALPGTIVFLSERAGQKDVWRVTPTGEEAQVTSAPEDEYPGPPSPDGRTLLVVASGEANGRVFQQLRAQPLSGGPAVGLHPPRPRARNASWGPDGTWLVTESDAQGFSDVVRLSPTANAVDTPVTRVKQGCFEPAVSPDGREVACVCSGEGDPEVYVYRADGTGEPRRITTFYMEDRSPQWSPDGRWLAFVSNRERRERVYLVRPDGSDLRALSGEGFAGDEREAAFSPDGQRVAYVARSEDGKSRIWVATVAGGAPVALTDGTHRDDMPAWSPDGKALVFVSERDGDTDLYLMRADGTGQTRLTKAKGADWLPRWFVPR
ncbi:tolB protein precursor protein [Corallococcus sp. CA053C]|uniref:TolB family protein n=1 Tax=Corallococcus sp. CA053C TaxID=2316732 RepID=UPI000EA2CADB|nr:LpqB family beta-propeller domain-containing protein [Corallococcus sp. CA053C]RKH09217.1 tolB protein precursor protein [Corallococcus sp. CA053C]